MIVYTDYLDKSFKNAKKLFDVESCTAADYTVEMKITEEFYNKFIESTHMTLKPPNMSNASFF